MSEELPPVLILAGGLGTRLGERAMTTPKALMEVAGRPFIDWQLLALRDAGFKHAVLAVGHLGDLIETSVGDGSRLGIEVAYSYDGPLLRGTLGALRQVAPLLADVVPVLFGDTYLTVDYGQVVRAQDGSPFDMTMCVHRNAGRWDTSNALVADGRVLAYSKDPPPLGAEWIDYGFSVLRRAAILESMEDDLAHWTEHAARAGRVGAFEVAERFYEIGTPMALRDTDAYLRSVFPDAP